MSGYAGFLQIEAVNIYATVFDTDQLSVIRGSSFLLKQAIESIAEYDQFKQYLTPLSTGASIGLFGIQPPDTPASDITALAERIIHFLNDTKHPFHPFTFLVSTTAETDFQTAKMALMSQIRRQQLRAPSFSIDKTTQTPRRPCSVEGRRAALGSSPNAMSDSVALRKKAGIDQRRHFYTRALQLENNTGEESVEWQRLQQFVRDTRLTDDLKSLGRNANYPQLNDKIAIIYMDGNGFGKLQKALVHTPADQITFDHHLQTKRRQLLAEILLKFIQLDDYATDDDKLRFEALLWGGDELTFICPAWLGFDLLYTLFNLMEGWKTAANEHNLTHAAGMVLCRANTPIYKTRQLATELAEHVKQCSREENLFEYLVLESMDTPSATDIGDLFQQRYHGLGEAQYRQPLMPVRNWQAYKEELRDDLAQLPRSQVYHVATLVTRETTYAFQHDNDLNATPFEAFEHRLATLMGANAYHRVCEHLCTLFHPLTTTEQTYPQLSPKRRAWLWLHLTELWDYLAPYRKESHAPKHNDTEGQP